LAYFSPPDKFEKAKWSIRDKGYSYELQGLDKELVQNAERGKSGKKFLVLNAVNPGKFDLVPSSNFTIEANVLSGVTFCRKNRLQVEKFH
jgi:hypothetical protein